MEITSKPLALDEVDRKVLQLEMERLSLVKAADTDRGARQRLAGLDSQLAALKEQQAELNAMWEEERDEMSKVQQLKGEIDRVNIEIQVGGRAGTGRGREEGAGGERARVAAAGSRAGRGTAWEGPSAAGPRGAGGSSQRAARCLPAWPAWPATPSPSRPLPASLPPCLPPYLPLPPRRPPSATTTSTAPLSSSTARCWSCRSSWWRRSSSWTRLSR